MRNSGWKETGGDAPESVKKRNERIEVNVKALTYALDSIPDDVLEQVIRLTLWKTPKPSWVKTLRREVLIHTANEVNQ